MEKIPEYSELEEKIKQAKNIEEILQAIKDSPEEFLNRPGDKYQAVAVDKIIESFVAQIKNLKDGGVDFDAIDFDNTNLIGVPEDKGLRARVKELAKETYNKYTPAPKPVPPPPAPKPAAPAASAAATPPPAAPANTPAQPPAPAAQPKAATGPAAPKAPENIPDDFFAGLKTFQEIIDKIKTLSKDSLFVDVDGNNLNAADVKKELARIFNLLEDNNFDKLAKLSAYKDKGPFPTKISLLEVVWNSIPENGGLKVAVGKAFSNIFTKFVPGQKKTATANPAPATPAPAAAPAPKTAAPKVPASAPVGAPPAAPAMTPDQIKLNAEFAEKIKDAKTMAELIDLVKTTKIDFVRPNDEYMKYAVPNILAAFMAEIQNFKQYNEPVDDVVLLSTFLMGIPTDKGLRDKAKSLIPQIQKDYVIIPGLVRKTVINTTPAPKGGPTASPKPAAATIPATPATPTGAPVMPATPESQKMIEDKNRIDELSKLGETPVDEVKAKLKALETAKNWAEYFPYLDEVRNLGILGGKETAKILSENLENKKGSALITAVESLSKIVETEIIDRDGVAEVAEKFLGRLRDQNLWATYAGLLIKGVESGLFDVSEEKTVHLIREGMEGCHANKWVYSFRLLKDLVKKTNLLTTGVYTPGAAPLGGVAGPASPEAATATVGAPAAESVRTGPKPPPIPGSKPSIKEVEKDPLTLADLSAAKYDVSKALKNKAFGEFLRELGGDVFEEVFKDADKTEGMLKKYHEIFVKKNLLSKEVMTVMREKLGSFSDSKFAQIDSKLMELAINEPEKILKMYSSVERLQSARKGIKIAEAKLSSITGVAIDKIKGKYDDADLKAITEILKKQKHGSTGLGVFALWNSPAYWYRRYQLKKNYGVDVESLADLAYNTSRATWKAHNRFANETMAKEFEEERAGIKDAFGVRTLEASKIAPHGSVRDNLTRVEAGEPGFDAKNKTRKNFGPGIWASMMSGVANAASKVSEQVKNLVDWAGNSKVKIWDRSGHRSFDNVLNRILGDNASELNPSLDSVSKIESKYEQGRNELLASIFSEREVEDMMKEESEKYLKSSMEKIFSAESDWNKLLEPLKEIISLEKELNGNIARGMTRNILEIISDHIATEKDVVKRLALTSLFGQLSAFAGPVQAEEPEEGEDDDEEGDEGTDGGKTSKTPRSPKTPGATKTPKTPKTPGTPATSPTKKTATKGKGKAKSVKPEEEAETEYSPLDTGAPTSYEEEELVDLGDGLFDEKMVGGANEVHYLVDKDGKKISSEKYERLAKDSEGRLIGRVYDKDGKKNDNWYILDPKTGNPLELADGRAKDTEVGKPAKAVPESKKAPAAPEVVPTAPVVKTEEEPEYNPLENDRDAGDLSREPKVVTKAEATKGKEEVPESKEEVITPEVKVASEPIEKYSPDRNKKYSMNDTLDLGDGLLRKTVQHDDKLSYLLINKDGQTVSDYEYDDLVSNGEEIFGIFGDGKDDRIYSIDKTNGELIDMVETTDQSIPSPEYKLETIPNLGHGMYDRTETVDGKVLHFITDIRGKKLLSGHSFEKLDLTHDGLFGLSAVDGEWYEIHREKIEKEEKENEHILKPLGLGQYDLTETLDDEVVHYVTDMYGAKLYDRPYAEITKDKNGNLLSVDQNGKWWKIVR